jgi:hypothetical protein
VSADASELQIRREALAEGMNTLLMATLLKVRNGKTTLAELFRVIEIDEVDRGSGDECPSCGAVTEPDYLACPTCACRLAPACPSCDRKVLEHWKALSVLLHASDKVDTRQLRSAPASPAPAAFAQAQGGAGAGLPRSNRPCSSSCATDSTSS